MQDEIRELKKDVKQIKENHLPHLKTDVAILNVKIKWVLGILGTVFIGIYVPIVKGWLV